MIYDFRITNKDMRIDPTDVPYIENRKPTIDNRPILLAP